MRRYLIFFSFAAAVVLASCRGGSNGQTGGADADSLSVDSLSSDTLDEDFSHVIVPKAADELFDDFVFNFAGNRQLQRERIVFPLKVVEDGHERLVERKSWQMDHFFMRQGYYTLLFDSERHMEAVKDTSLTHAVVEKISFDEQTVRQYVFNRIRGTWMMTSINQIPLSQSHNASFLAFYQQFAVSQQYQTKHLEPTVGFVGPDPDDDFKMMEGIITRDTWEAFAPELPSKSIWNIVYGKPEKEGTRKIYVLRGIANGLELQMNFRKHGKDWKLSKLIT